MMVTRAVVSLQKGASGAPNWVTGESLMLVTCSFFLAHRHSSRALGHCSFVASRFGRFRTQRATGAYNKMRLNIVGLEYLPGKSDGVFLAKFLAGTHVNIDLAV